MTADRRSQLGREGGRVLWTIAAVVVISGTAWLVHGHSNKPKTHDSSVPTSSLAPTQQSSPSSAPPAQTTASQVHSSSKEKATFTYPSSWTIAKPVVTSNDATNSDQAAIVSPSGGIKISWVTDITGFGNEHSSSYPLITVVDKTPISGAPGYFVVSGVTTLDGTTYHPWIAVQDANGILTSGVMGDVATFQGKHNLNASTGATTGILFSTSGLRTSQNTPSLAQAQATAWFSGSEAQQAKQILLSFSDPN